MSNQLVLPSGVDKLSLPQKGVALAAVGVGAYFALPILAAMMVNLFMVVIIGGPMLFVAYNYKAFWTVFKNVSWHMTKALIGLDVLSYMDRYLDWVAAKKQVLIQSRNDLQRELAGADGSIKEAEQEYARNVTRAEAAEKANNTVQLNIALSAAQDAKDLIEALSPVRRGVEKQIEYLSELIDVYEVKEQQLGNTVKTQKIKFKTLKAMSKGMGAAAEVIGGAGDANKQWEVSKEILIQQMNQFTANVQTYEAVVKPAIEEGRFDKQLRQEQGMKLLAEFKKTNFQLEK